MDQIIRLFNENIMAKEKYFNFTTEKCVRLDEYLRQVLPKAIVSDMELKQFIPETAQTKEKLISNSKIRRLIVAGQVSVNSRVVVRPSFELREKSKIQVYIEGEKFFYEKQPEDVNFEISAKDILFEDDDLIFVNKPAFFPVEQTIVGNRANLHDVLVDFLWKRNPSLRNPPYVGIMHRLDRETSGVILFTKNREINKSISQMFQEHNFIKEYFALCGTEQSKDFPKELTVEKFIGRISKKSEAGKWGTLKESLGGLYSKTQFTFVKKIAINGRNYNLVHCNLFTGRTHQIRVHLSEAGFPILGDELYGGNKADRLYLHASRLCAKSEKLNFDVISNADFYK